MICSPLARDVRLGPGYQYENRNSNDPEKRFDSQVFGDPFIYFAAGGGGLEEIF